MERAQENKSIFDLLKELADIQYNRAKIEAAVLLKKGTKLVAGKVNDMRECILESANEYNQKIEFVEDTKTIKNTVEAQILRNYELSLNAIKREYEAMRNGIANEKGNLEKIEATAAMRQEYYGKKLEEEKKKPEYIRGEELKVQIKEALDSGDVDKVKNLVEELQTVSKGHNAKEYEKEYNENLLVRKRVEEQRAKWDKILDSLPEEERKAIEIIAGKKEDLLKTANEKYLAVVGQDSWFKKIFKKIANAFSAGKRYSENVINVLSDKVDNISQKIVPDLSKTIQEKTEALKKQAEKLMELTPEEKREEAKEVSKAFSTQYGDTSQRSAKMYEITKGEEEHKAEEAPQRQVEEKEEIKEEPKKEEPKEETKEEVKEEPKEGPKEEVKEEAKEEEEKEKETKKIEFKQNERINPWKVVGMGKTIGWRQAGKGRQLKIDNRKAGRPVKDDEEKTTDNDEGR